MQCVGHYDTAILTHITYGTTFLAKPAQLFLFFLVVFNPKILTFFGGHFLTTTRAILAVAFSHKFLAFGRDTHC